MDSDEDYMEQGENLRYRRYKNPDGTKGGWVSTEAHVAKTAYVARNAMVEGSARVKGRARILGEAEVHGNIEGDAVICDEAYAGPGCTVKGCAVLSGRSSVRGQRNVIEGYTHLDNIEIGISDLTVSGGDFKGKPTLIGSTPLYANLDNNGRLASIYLFDGSNGNIEIENAAELLKHLTIEKKYLQAKDTRGR